MVNVPYQQKTQAFLNNPSLFWVVLGCLGCFKKKKERKAPQKKEIKKKYIIYKEEIKNYIHSKKERRKNR